MTKSIPSKLIFIAFLVFASCFFIFNFNSASAASPVLFFSDLIDGPKTGWEGSATKGAAVTIWGQNFGASRGSSYVTVNGAQLTSDSDYAEWGVSSGNARGLERITFWLNNTCANGAGMISVTVNNVTSNTLPFTVRSGNIYFISPSGSDLNNGTTVANAWRNPYYARRTKNSVIQPGDIIYFKGGVYTTVDPDQASVHIRFRTGDSGESGSPIALISYPGETAIIGNHIAASGIGQYNYQSNGILHDMVFAKFKFDVTKTGIAQGLTESPNLWNNLRCVGNDIQNLDQRSDSGAFFFSYAHDIVMYGNYINNSGSHSWDHGIYINTENSNVGRQARTYNIYIGWNEIANQNIGNAIRLGPRSNADSYQDDIYIHDNYIHGSGREFIHINGWMEDVYIYNNIIENNGLEVGGGAAGVRITNINGDTHNPNIRVYQNTFYNSNNIDYLHDFVDSSTTAVSFKNNIYYVTASDTFYNDANWAGSRSSDYDVFYNFAVPPWSAHSVNSNPLFVNGSIGNFHLQEASPAKDAGTSAVNTVVTKDYDGISRPQGLGFDIGAFEYVSQTFHPADTNQNGKIEMRELIAFVGKWKSTQATVDDVLTALDRWLGGM